MTLSRALTVLLVVAGLTAPSFVPAQAASDQEEATRKERLARAARMVGARDAYLRHCASCHGEDGSGPGIAPDFTSPAAVAEMTRPGMVAAVRGKHQTADAAAWQDRLGPTGLDDVIDYIREALMLPAPDADTGPGRAIYARTCSVCHGERGNGASWAKNSLDPAPVDFTAQNPNELTRQKMINTVTYGSPKTAMMPFSSQFSREEIISVVDYIRANFMKVAVEMAAESPSHDRGAQGTGAHEHGTHEHREQDHADSGHGTQDHAAAADETRTAAAGGGHADAGHGGAHAEHGGVSEDPNAPFPQGLVGDFWKGKTFFDANCAECHGAKGKGDGRRAYFMREKPKDFTTERARADFNRPHLFLAIAKGVRQTEMPAWSKVLNPQQIANVAEYVYLSFLHPDQRPAGGGQDTPVWQRESGETKKN